MKRKVFMGLAVSALAVIIQGSAAMPSLAQDSPPASAASAVVSPVKGDITAACPPGSTARVIVGSSPTAEVEVGNVRVICEKGGSAEVSIGAVDAEAARQAKGTVSTKVKAKDVTSIVSGEGSKSSTNIGGVSTKR